MIAKKDVSLPEEVESYLEKGYRLMLITFHRRESFGEPMKEVFSAIKKLVKRYKDLVVLYPVHPNSNVKNKAHGILQGIDRYF